jgi:hypothetical protein
VLDGHLDGEVGAIGLTVVRAEAATGGEQAGGQRGPPEQQRPRGSALAAHRGA